MEDSAKPVNRVRPAATVRGRTLPDDPHRGRMMAREASLPLAERIALFEALSRDAAWARAAVRVR